MLQPRKVDFENRKKFCVAFIGKAYPFRMQAIAALSRISKVDVYGGIARNADSARAQEKYKTAQEYKFVFSFENDLYPGYVTEKPIEAWATGAIPLYWGLDAAQSLNSEALINLVDYKDLETYVDYVSEVNSSAEKWCQIASQPILKVRPNLDAVLALLRNSLSDLIIG